MLKIIFCFVSEIHQILKNKEELANKKLYLYFYATASKNQLTLSKYKIDTIYPRVTVSIGCRGLTDNKNQNLHP